jgi:hypothetical protein
VELGDEIQLRIYILPSCVGWKAVFFDGKEGAESRVLQIGHYGTQITNNINC